MSSTSCRAAVNEYEDEYEGEYEYETPQDPSAGTQSYFWVEGFQVTPTGYVSIQSNGPFWGTQGYANNATAGMCQSLMNSFPGWKIGVRCLRWTGSTWVPCGLVRAIACPSVG